MNKFLNFKKIVYRFIILLLIFPLLCSCTQKKKIEETDTTNKKDFSKNIEDVYEFPEITIDFKEFPVEIIGYNGYGVVQNRINLLPDEKMKEMIGFKELQNLQKKVDMNKEGNRYTALRDYISDLAHFIDEFEVYMDKPTYLKNGDIVTVTIKYDTSITDRYKNIHIKNNKMEIPVNGLKDYYNTLNDVPDSLKNNLKKQADIFGDQYMKKLVEDGIYDGYTYNGLKLLNIEWESHIEKFIDNINDRGAPFVYEINNNQANCEYIDYKYHNMILLQCYKITYTVKLSNNTYTSYDTDAFDKTLTMYIYKIDESDHYENWIFDEF